jgi:integrase
MIYKRGEVYWFKFVWKGKEIRKSAKTGNDKVARQIEAAYKTQLAKGEVGIDEKPPAPPFAEFAEGFLKTIAIEKCKPKTVAFYRDRVSQLLKYDPFRTILLDAITKDEIEKFIKWRTRRTRTYAIRRANRIEMGDTFRPVTVASINRDLATLRRILRYALEKEVISRVPVIHLLPGEVNCERVISHKEEAAYLSQASGSFHDFATIMLDTGMRPEEVCRLRWEHVHLEPIHGARFGYIHNPQGKTKFAKRDLSLTERVRAGLQARHIAAGEPNIGFVFPRADKPSKPVPYSTVDSQHDRTLEKAKVRFRLYDLRHTMLTRLGESGADAFQIRKIAGHSSILISQRYVHPTPERSEEAFSKLDAYNILKREQETARAAKEAAAGNTDVAVQLVG